MGEGGEGGRGGGGEGGGGGEADLFVITFPVKIQTQISF